jgi:hypothetical protein
LTQHYVTQATRHIAPFQIHQTQASTLPLSLQILPTGGTKHRPTSHQHSASCQTATSTQFPARPEVPLAGHQTRGLLAMSSRACPTHCRQGARSLAASPQFQTHGDSWQEEGQAMTSASSGPHRARQEQEAVLHILCVSVIRSMSLIVQVINTRVVSSVPGLTHKASKGDRVTRVCGPLNVRFSTLQDGIRKHLCNMA